MKKNQHLSKLPELRRLPDLSPVAAAGISDGPARQERRLRLCRFSGVAEGGRAVLTYCQGLGGLEAALLAGKSRPERV